MRLHQQTPDCSDFDVIFSGSGTPAFRVLLPEWLFARGLECESHLHTIPGSWTFADGTASGRFSANDQIELSVAVEPRQPDILVTLGATNIGSTGLADVYANVCSSVNHISGDPAWCNEQFLPGLPLDRSVQGRYWYEKLTPRGLFALTHDGWVPMHPRPADPDAEKVPPYQQIKSEKAVARACAVQSPGGDAVFFQSWDAPCRHCAPFHGNACMHLEAFLADSLHPGESAAIHGVVGIHTGDLDSLAVKLDED